MPAAALKPCSKVGCRSLSRERYCEEHQQQAYHRYDQNRGTAAERGYDGKWRKAREAFLRKHPLCARCQGEGRLSEATVVDHIKPHKGDRILFWDRQNWQSLCETHHNSKTVKEDGGFGRANEQNLFFSQKKL